MKAGALVKWPIPFSPEPEIQRYCYGDGERCTNLRIVLDVVLGFFRKTELIGCIYRERKVRNLL